MIVKVMTMTVTFYFHPTNVGSSVLQVKTSLCQSLSPVSSLSSSLASHKKIKFQMPSRTTGTVPLVVMKTLEQLALQFFKCRCTEQFL